MIALGNIVTERALRKDLSKLPQDSNSPIDAYYMALATQIKRSLLENNGLSSLRRIVPNFSASVEAPRRHRAL